MSDLLLPECIGSDFVAIARSEVASVEVDGEIVLYDDATRRLHRLNPTASALWQCLDGTGTLADIAADIAEVYRTDVSAVLDQVIAVARQFGAEGLLVGVGDPIDLGDGSAQDGPDGAASSDAPETGAPDPFVLEPPTPCMDATFQLGDAGSITVQAGNQLLGLRFSNPELAEFARSVFSPALVSGVVAPPNVSIATTTTVSGRPLLYCYRSGWLVTRARSPRRAMEAAITYLSTYGRRLPLERPTIYAMAAVRGGVAVLLSPDSRIVIEGLAPRLRASGWEVVDSPWVEIDPGSGDLVIPPINVEIDTASLERLPRDRSELAPPAPGHYPVKSWVALPSEGSMPITQAARLVAVAAASPVLSVETAPLVVQAVQAMLSRADWVECPALDAATIARLLV
jgi:hypothetical protein